MKDSVAFISTKLMMPAPRKNYIRREVLIGKLENMSEYKVVLVQGSAGSGKTTLLTSFIKEKSLTSTKWITIDKDTNVFSFWHYFLESVKEHLGKEKDNVISLFNSILQKDDIEKIVVILINQLSLADDITLVLDDFHHIRDEYLLKTIQFFINNSPDNIHLVLLTRERPSLYLGELSMSGQLLEIGEDDLRFTFDEGVMFLRNTLNIELDSQLVNKINRLAEGWVGGLQLLTLAISNRASFIGDIKVLNKYMVEYLSQEIFASLSDEEKNFLIHTSVLNYFSENICNQVLGQVNAREIIDRLLRRNLFIIEINDGEAYRYHNIFDEFLKMKFSQLDPSTREEIHYRAAIVYKNNGDFDESIKHYLIIERYQEALKVIEEIGQNPKGWVYLNQIPLEWIAKNKELTMQNYFYNYSNLEFDKCKQILQIMHSQAHDKLSLSMFNFARALLEQQYFEVDLNILSDLDIYDIGDVTKAIILLNISVFLAVQDNYQKALELIKQVLEIESSLNNPYLKFHTLTLKAQIKEELGELNESLAVYEQTFRVIEENPLLAPLAANNYVGIAGVSLKSCNFNLAEQSLLNKFEITYKGYYSLETVYYTNLIELKCLTGKIQEAKEIFEIHAPEMQKNSLLLPIIFKQLIFLGFEKEVLDTFITLSLRHKKHISSRVEDKLLYVRILILQQKMEEALELIDEVLEFLRQRKLKLYLIQGLLLKMLIVDYLGGKDSRGILNLLREAVYYSYENRIISPFIFERELVKKYIAELREERIKDLSLKEKSFVSELMIILHHDNTDSLLTEREAEVLSILASGATNKEIAQTLYISVATVKTHIINIYSKLQVANRVEAVEKAKKEGIL